MEEKKGLIIFIIVILSLSTLGLGGYLLYDKVILNFFKEEDVLVKTSEVSIDLNAFYQISDTLDKMDTAFNDSKSSFYGYLYLPKKISAEKFDKNAALYAASYKYLEGRTSLPSSVVKDSFEKMFGKSLTYQAQNIEAGDVYKISYNSENNSYSYAIPSTSKVVTTGYYTVNTKTAVESEKIIITRKVFYAEYQNNSDNSQPTSATIYKLSDKKNRVGTISLKNGLIDASEVVGKYGSKLNTYKITFKFNRQDDYSFYSIERTKK